jgi:hypothetical protein
VLPTSKAAVPARKMAIAKRLLRIALSLLPRLPALPHPIGGVTAPDSDHFRSKWRQCYKPAEAGGRVRRPADVGNPARNMGTRCRLAPGTALLTVALIRSCDRGHHDAWPGRSVIRAVAAPPGRRAGRGRRAVGAGRHRDEIRAGRLRSRDPAEHRAPGRRGRAVGRPARARLPPAPVVVAARRAGAARAGAGLPGGHVRPVPDQRGARGGDRRPRIRAGGPAGGHAAAGDRHPARRPGGRGRAGRPGRARRRRDRLRRRHGGR